MTTASAIIDLEGFCVTPTEAELLRHPSIAGVILFSRNYASQQQLLALTQQIQSLNPQLLIAVDQEGGRVQRFVEGFTLLPAMSHWGQEYLRHPKLALQLFREMLNIMLSELKAVGITMTLAPVLDIDYEVSDIIGERSFSADPNVIVELAESMISQLHRFAMPAVAKHFPGHGAVALDSHKCLPIDRREFKQLQQCDLLPYQKLLHRLDAIMPAHIIYPCVDSEYPASFSAKWLRGILRDQMQFSGVIISDDISMQGAAAMGNYAERAALALDAGCDLITICNNHCGVIEALPILEKWHDDASQQRIQELSKP